MINSAKDVARRIELESPQWHPDYLRKMQFFLSVYDVEAWYTLKTFQVLLCDILAFNDCQIIVKIVFSILQCSSTPISCKCKRR